MGKLNRFIKCNVEHKYVLLRTMLCFISILLIHGASAIKGKLLE